MFFSDKYKMELENCKQNLQKKEELVKEMETKMEEMNQMHFRAKKIIEEESFFFVFSFFFHFFHFKKVVKVKNQIVELRDKVSSLIFNNEDLKFQHTHEIEKIHSQFKSKKSFFFFLIFIRLNLKFTKKKF